jgi:hypothetical protein
MFYWYALVESQSKCVYKPHEMVFKITTLFVVIYLKLVNEIFLKKIYKWFVYILFFKIGMGDLIKIMF